MGWSFWGIIFSLAINSIEFDAEKVWNQYLLGVHMFRKMVEVY